MGNKQNKQELVVAKDGEKLSVADEFWNKAVKSGDMQKQRDYYERAAGEYRIAKDFKRAGLAFRVISELYEMEKDIPEAANKMADAAKNFARSDLSQAVECYELAAELYERIKRKTRASELLVESAQNVEAAFNEGRIKADVFVAAMQKAIDVLNRAGDSTIAAKYQRKFATNLFNAGAYADAVPQFQQNVDSILLDFEVSSKDVAAATARMLICILCRDAPKEDFKEVTSELEKQLKNKAFANHDIGANTDLFVKAYVEGDQPTFDDSADKLSYLLASEEDSTRDGSSKFLVAAVAALRKTMKVTKTGGAAKQAPKKAAAEKKSDIEDVGADLQ